jgi:dTDP-4-dehydrorhamnose reductase
MDQKTLNRQIVILGSRGMLGQVAKKYFSGVGYGVTCFDERFEPMDRNPYSDFLRGLRHSILINCVGKIRQKSADPGELLIANTILPAELRNCLHEEVILVQPSTDCVFNGQRGTPYPAKAATDATDEYGWSKRLGEVVLLGRPNTLVPRVSIIGPDHNPKGRGLFSWVISNPPGSRIKGYTNHLWNGITTLEWCKQVEHFLKKEDGFEFQLLQFGTSEHYSKYEMLGLFNEIFKLQLFIEPFATDITVDRRLLADIVCKPLPAQLTEMASF